MPLNSDVFAAPSGYNAPQQVPLFPPITILLSFGYTKSRIITHNLSSTVIKNIQDEQYIEYMTHKVFVNRFVTLINESEKC